MGVFKKIKLDCPYCDFRSTDQDIMSDHLIKEIAKEK